MFTPNLNVKLSVPIIVLGVGIAFSYFTHVGWWALLGITVFFGLLTESKWSDFWFIISAILLGLSIWKMGWVYF